MLQYRRLAGAFANAFLPVNNFCVPAVPRRMTRRHSSLQVYEPFFADFGPLNLGCAYRFCHMLQSSLKVRREAWRLGHELHSCTVLGML